jgi:UDP-galactopyranose mutase
MPIGGFSKMINKMLKHPLIKIIHQKPNIELKNKKVLINNQLITGHVFYCGQIDELFHYCYGSIPYRSLHIDFETKKMNSYQPASVVNYPAHKTMTRIAEYKKINSQNNKNFTTISKEYPGAYDLNSKKFNKPYYPIHNPINIRLYNKYLKLANNFTNLHLLGRLAEYKYFDMDDAIDNAMLKYQKFEKSI